IVARAREVTDEMFLVAARELSQAVPSDRLARGALYPALSDLRPLSRAIAKTVARAARDQGFGRIMSDEEISAAVEGAMWTPEYVVS
ncbi:MAG TPA: malic enzyme-like NAD(P)-binding protein, partial [Acidimicrobiales bacterium]|nr:malic enzyme-like NAD(P)-binding protein [Acidimicrobiales bacterium]